MDQISFRDLSERQRALYPKARLQDLVKALHQSFLGCGHLLEDEAGSFRRLAEEWAAPSAGLLSERLAGGFSRLHLGAAREEGLSPETAQRLFSLSANVRTGQEAGFLASLREAAAAESPAADDEDRAFLRAYLPLAPRMLSHSGAFRAAYRPAYRVITDDLAAVLPVFSRVDRLLASAPRAVIGIDGGCAGGKTTIARLLKAVYGAAVIPMDDFFLRPEQRTKERFTEPGGNVDRERFLTEVAPFLRQGGPFSYRPFDCGTMGLGKAKAVPAARLVVVEGSYALHPELRGLYDLAFFVQTDGETRRRRILRREGDRAPAFFTRWIPLEDRYFEAFRPDLSADAVPAFPDVPWPALPEKEEDA